MQSPRFDWDDGNLHEIGKHRVTPAEVEEALADPHQQSRGAYTVDTEERAAVLGATRAGRVLLVVITLRDGAIRVVTAYRARPRLRREYLEGR